MMLPSRLVELRKGIARLCGTKELELDGVGIMIDHSLSEPAIANFPPGAIVSAYDFH